MATAQRVSAAMAHLGAIKPLGDQTNSQPAFNFGIGKVATTTSTAVAPSSDHFQVRVAETTQTAAR